MYRQELFSSPTGKSMRLSFERQSASGLIIPQTLAHIAFSRLATEQLSSSTLIIPTAATTYLINAQTHAGESIHTPISGTEFATDSLDQLTHKIVEVGLALIREEQLVDVDCTFGDSISDEQRDAIQGAGFRIMRGAQDKPDDRPLPGFYL